MSRSARESNQPLCPVCGFANVRMFLRVPSMPVFSNVLWSTREEALSAARGDLDLGYCGRCGHVYNFAFDPRLLEYGASYENSLHFSSRFQRYAETLASDLIESFALRDRDIVEIGCGQGDFLRLLCAMGGNRGAGFDPGFRPDDQPNTAAEIRLVADLYDERYADLPVDFLCCRHLLEHVQDPAAFLDGIRRTLGTRRGVGIFFEVPDVEFTLRDLAIWDLIYEHCSYFTESSIRRLFSDRGFSVRRTYGTFGGQFLCVEAIWGGPGDTVQTAVVREQAGAVVKETREEQGWGGPASALTAAVDAFPTRYMEKVDSWRRAFARIRADGRKAVVWGAGSKGVTILNVLRDADPVDYVVDVNPRKHGMYVSGSGQKIVPPEFLRTYRPDVVVAMNSIYEREIRGMLAELGVRAEFVAA